MNKKRILLTLLVTVLMITIVMALSGSGSSGQVAFWSNSTDLTGSNNLYWDNNNSKLGIGTTGPAYKLDVNGSWALRGNGYFYNSTAYAYDPTNNKYLAFFATGGKGYVGMLDTSPLILQTNGGKVGIGTTGPNAKLQVNSGDIAVATQGNGLILKATNGANCYRLTVNNAGVLNTTSVTCP